MIYLDNSATHPILPCVKQTISENIDSIYNPSTLYSVGKQTRKLIDKSKQIIAKSINCGEDEIYFTSGATESNAIAVNSFKNQTISKSKFEHDGLALNPYIKASDNPNILMLVNNEIGENYTEYITSHDILYSDATAAYGNININVKQLNADMLGASSEKLGAPSGCGLLYVKNGIKINPITFGHQQKGYRPGTENTLGIITFATAVEYQMQHLDEKYEHCILLKQTLLDELTKYGIDFILNGKNTIPHICSVSFKNVESEAIGLLLDAYGVCVSSGSACNSGNLEPSNTIKSLNLPKEYVNGTIRFSFSLENTVDEIKFVADKINQIINQIGG